MSEKEKIFATVVLVASWDASSIVIVVWGSWWALFNIIGVLPDWLVQSRAWNESLGPMALLLFSVIPPMALLFWPFGPKIAEIWGEEF